MLTNRHASSAGGDLLADGRKYALFLRWHVGNGYGNLDWAKKVLNRGRKADQVRLRRLEGDCEATGADCEVVVKVSRAGAG